MAVQLSIDINDYGYDQESNTSVATVTIKATYSAGSYNRNASGTLYINGAAYPFTASINGQQQDHGEEEIYSQTVVIDRSATDVVDCSATVNVGGSTGTISTSGSLTLTGSPPSGGGGDSGGDEEDEYRYRINATVGEYTAIVITDGANVLRTITESGKKDVYTTSSIIRIYAYVLKPESYELATFTCNRWTEVPADGFYRVEGSLDYTFVEATVVTLSRPKANVYIDTGEEFAKHLCYIDNGTGWDLYAPYIDNGTGWDLCT
jgi:hypothetical protein